VAKLTLMVFHRNAHRVATLGDSLLGQVFGDRLDYEGLVGAGGFSDGKCSLAPECVDILV
jgi:hypothetical protein